MRIADLEKGFTISELLAVFAIVALLAAALLPFARATLTRRDHVQCRANLMGIGKALFIYASENGGAFPQQLDELYEKEYLTDVSFLDCPGTLRVGSLEKRDYEYTPGLTVKSESDKVLLRDRSGNHPRGLNALLVNGEIRTD